MVRKLLETPRVFRPFVHTLNGPSHMRIDEAKQPSNALLRLMSNVQPQRLKKHDISQLATHQCATRLRIFEFRPHSFERPTYDFFVSLPLYVNDSRQCAQQRLGVFTIKNEVSSDHETPAVPLRQLVFTCSDSHFTGERNPPISKVGRKGEWNPMWEQKTIASIER